MPQNPTEYGAGHNSVWEHYISVQPDQRKVADTRHQWAICGGEMMGGKDGPYDPDLVITYLHQALNASGFQRLTG